MKRNMLKTVALLVSLMLLLSVLPAAFAGENEVTQVVL